MKNHPLGSYHDKILSVLNSCKNTEQIEAWWEWINRIVDDKGMLGNVYLTFKLIKIKELGDGKSID